MSVPAVSNCRVNICVVEKAGESDGVSRLCLTGSIAEGFPTSNVVDESCADSVGVKYTEHSMLVVVTSIAMR